MTTEPYYLIPSEEIQTRLRAFGLDPEHMTDDDYIAILKSNPEIFYSTRISKVEPHVTVSAMIQDERIQKAEGPTEAEAIPLMLAFLLEKGHIQRTW